MNFKKIMSSALAGVMALSLAVPAFAADGDLEQSTAITGTTQAPTIKITVPATGTVTVNPYKMEVTVGSDKKTDQIISATQYIENASNVAIKVSAQVTGTAAGNLAFATATTQGTKAVTTNSVFMYFEMDVADKNDGTADPTWATAYDSKSATQILISTKATKKADMLTLAAGTGTAAASTGGYAAFHLAGDAASAPTSAWTDADKADVAIAFTFTPTSTSTATP
ncbi:MAG: hypothetical protein K2P37_13630 [Oscillospiraceae bacterium]|nr:hypothetical protein [Oscillospiraceae bacterium]